MTFVVSVKSNLRLDDILFGQVNTKTKKDRACKEKEEGMEGWTISLISSRLENVPLLAPTMLFLTAVDFPSASPPPTVTDYWNLAVRFLASMKHNPRLCH